MTAHRVVVCGAGFGQIYLAGMVRAGLELRGILSRGGEHSRAQARHWGVPLYTSVRDLPNDVDIACVVVRSEVFGGQGSQLARELLARGVHVLQEQPVHADDLAATLRIAKKQGMTYRVNPFYAYLPAVRRFVHAARTLARLRRLCFVDAACSVQVSYPLVDILGRALGELRPWGFYDPAELPEDLVARATGEVPFRILHGLVGGLPLTLRVQNQLHSQDPDNHAYLLHRITIGSDGGMLTLVDTHGPVLWTPRTHIPRDDSGNLALTGTAVADAGTVVLGPQQLPGLAQLLDETWPDGVRSAVEDLITAMNSERVGSRAADQYALATSTVWQELTRRLGPAEPIHAPAPRPLPGTELLAEIDRTEEPP